MTSVRENGKALRMEIFNRQYPRIRFSSVAAVQTKYTNYIDSVVYTVPYFYDIMIITINT